MSDVAQNCPPKVKIPTLTVVMENNKTYTTHIIYEKIGPLPIKNSPTQQYITSTNNAASKDEYWPEIRRTQLTSWNYFCKIYPSPRGLREYVRLKTYLHGPMDYYAKKLKLRFRVGDLDLPERRKRKKKEVYLLAVVGKRRRGCIRVCVCGRVAQQYE